MADQQYEPVMPVAVTPMHLAPPAAGGADQYEIPQYPVEQPPAAKSLPSPNVPGKKDTTKTPKQEESTQLRTAQMERSNMKGPGESQSSGETMQAPKGLLASKKRKDFCKKYTVFQRVTILIGIIFLVSIGLGLAGAYFYFAFFGLEGRKK